MKKKNILLIMTDQHRIDHVGFGRNPEMQTPHIDRIAESVGFTNCISSNPICTPARSALLTGKYTHQIGMLAMSGDLSLQHPTYLRALQKAGYYTSAIGKLHWNQGWPWGREIGKGHDLVKMKNKMKKYGLDHIWEVSGKQLIQRNYCDYAKHLDDKDILDIYRMHARSTKPKFNHEPDDDSSVAFPFEDEDYVDNIIGSKALEQMAQMPKDKPFFLFASFCGPHPPQDPPQSYIDQVEYDESGKIVLKGEIIDRKTRKGIYKTRQYYKAMVKVIDDQVGRIFDKLESENQLKDTVIVFTCDHGDMLGDMGRMGKKRFWWQSVNVPTAIRHPGYLNNLNNHHPIELTDITATILDIAGLDAQKELSKNWPRFHDIVPCRSLMPVITGEKEKIRDFAFSECDNRWQIIQTDKWKYVKYLKADDPEKPNEELYDLDNDPEEENDVSAVSKNKKDLERCRKRLALIMDSTPPAQLQWAPLIGYKDNNIFEDISLKPNNS